MERMTINECAKLTGLSPLTIRVGLQQGALPFGAAFKTQESNHNYTYVIYPEKVKEYFGGMEDGQEA